MAKKKDLIEFLKDKGLLSAEDVKLVLKEAKDRDVSPEEVLTERGLVPEEKVAASKGEVFDVPVKLFARDETVPREILTLIPEESSRHYGLVAFAKDYDTLSVGMLRPDDVKAQEALKFIAQKLNLALKIFVVTPSDVSRFLQTYQTFAEEIKKALEAITREFPVGKEVAPQRKIVRLDEALAKTVREEAPIIRMVSLLLRQAVIERSSDIHIEPERTRLKVRYRIDGDLQSRLFLPLEVHSAVITRVKIMANLKIDETRIPQDGRFRTAIDNREIDFRVSSFPTASGEKVAIRVLDPTTGLKGLEELGFHPWNEKIVKEGMAKPFGMILATGPTGSGKTTTLYAILQLLNKEDVNIVTLEDPIEYFVPGLNQSQVLPEIGYTFSTGLRSIVRQDPDIIMVGEMRDAETAELGVHAALTGHLVLSTLHTNNAIGVIPRLVDLGVKPFLLPPTLNLMMSQRLVRRLCPDCKKPVKAEGELEQLIDRVLAELPEALSKTLEYKKPYTVWVPDGCDVCNHKGTLGRAGVHEILRMTRELEKIILEGLSEAKLREEASRQGMITIRQEGVLKALEGVVSLQEVIQETT